MTDCQLGRSAIDRALVSHHESRGSNLVSANKCHALVRWTICPEPNYARRMVPPLVAPRRRGQGTKKKDMSYNNVLLAQVGYLQPNFPFQNCGFGGTFKKHVKWMEANIVYLYVASSYPPHVTSSCHPFCTNMGPVLFIFKLNLRREKQI